jgi:hypothetical protein
MMRSSSISTGWLYAALVLAFVGVFASLGSMGLVHDALHRTGVRDWQRLQRAEMLHSDSIERQIASQQNLRVEAAPHQ